MKADTDRLEKEAEKGGVSKEIKARISELEKELGDAREETEMFQMKWSQQMIQISELTDLNNRYVNALKKNGIKV